MSESGGRYQRSMAGMIGALLVTVLVIAAFVGFRAANRSDLVVEREPVDYLSAVRGIQDSGGLSVVYPPRLPAGWKATVVDHVPGERWSLTLLTDETRFVGIRQRQGTGSVQDLVETYVDDEAVEGDPVELDSALADRWRTFTDEGGDYALVAEVGNTSVLVVGTADEDLVEDFTASLVLAPVS